MLLTSPRLTNLRITSQRFTRSRFTSVSSTSPVSILPIQSSSPLTICRNEEADVGTSLSYRVGIVNIHRMSIAFLLVQITPSIQSRRQCLLH